MHRCMLHAGVGPDIAPPAQSNPLKQYEDTLEAQIPRLSVAVPEDEGPQRRKAAFQNRINPIKAGTCSMERRPPRAGSLSASIPRQSSSEGPQLIPPSPRNPRINRTLVAELRRYVVYHQILLIHLPNVRVLIGEDAQQKPTFAMLCRMRHHHKVTGRQRKERGDLSQIRQWGKIQRHLLAYVLRCDTLHPGRYLVDGESNLLILIVPATVALILLCHGHNHVRFGGMARRDPDTELRICGGCLNELPARHCRTASAARQGARVCSPGSSAQSSGPMCASQMTTKRVRNSFTDIQNSQSLDERDDSSSRSRSFSAFHSQLRSDHAPHQTPPHSPPIQGLRSRIRLVSPPDDPLPDPTQRAMNVGGDNLQAR
uniref:Uncharacterized protein n=1 Tax=Anopheles culicifacies TaxID=139723 RepID=A0A182LYN8_9DIPT